MNPVPPPQRRSLKPVVFVAVLVMSIAAIACLWPNPKVLGGTMLVVEPDAATLADWKERLKAPRGELALEAVVEVGQPVEFHFIGKTGRRETLWIQVDAARREWDLGGVVPLPKRVSRCNVHYRCSADGQLYQEARSPALNEESEVGEWEPTWQLQGYIHLQWNNRLRLDATYRWHPEDPEKYGSPGSP